MNKGQAYINDISGLSYEELQKLDLISDSISENNRGNQDKGKSDDLIK